MTRLKVALTGLVLCLANATTAQDRTDQGAAALDEAMRKDPDQFIETVTDLIAGYGGAAGLSKAGIDEFIALERAAARASEVRRFIAMDLNADGSVGRDELAVSQRAANAGARGRLEREFQAADQNVDGRIDATEQRAEGQAAAMRRLDEGEAAMLQALMALDANSDGAVTLSEVQAEVFKLGEAT